jgi:glycosyltransferase involved in cell wall biosynthesis
MKIIILSTFERTGGAAIAANRLMQALNKSGHEAGMLVRDKQTDDPNVTTINTSWMKKKINFIRFAYERWVIFIHNRFGKKNLFAVSIANTGTDVSKHPLVKEADIINLHWINQGFLSLNDIRKLMELGKPIVWTMHDQWSYTGLCHYTSGCLKFQTHCFDCEKLKGYRRKDLSWYIFEKKKQILKINKLTAVGCSRWIANEALKNKIAEIESIPNPIDTNIYFSKNKCDARRQYNLPENKKLILFGGYKVTDKRKGIDYLISSCNILFQKKTFADDELLIIVFGGKADQLAALLPYTVRSVGYIHNETMMSQLYCAVDLFLIPSLEDNLPNTIMESMASGTPCVGFNTGGIPEMIDHKQNGYVAEYKNAEDLVTGIEWVLENTAKLNLSDACVKKVEENYSEAVVTKKYIDLYTKTFRK